MVRFMRSIFLPSNLRGAGDVVAIFAKPVARVIDAATAMLTTRYRTDLKNCTGCGRRIEKLNKILAFSKNKT